MNERDASSPQARLEAARKQVRLARETIRDEEPQVDEERLQHLVRQQAVSDAIDAVDIALNIERYGSAAMEARQ